MALFPDAAELIASAADEGWSRYNPPETYSSPVGTAILYVQLGEESKASDSLEKACGDGDWTSNRPLIRFGPSRACRNCCIEPA